jgi:hypothetical protein
MRTAYAADPEKLKQRVKSRRHLQRKRWAERYYTDPSFRAKNRLRARFNSMLKTFRKSASFHETLGCDRSTLIYHLEAQFQPGMTWENMGEWHIDHIRPCKSFDLSDPDQQRACFHYTNLQPLWAADNMRKGARVVEPEERVAA